jgi:geranylgeranyl pyrophosphate synthase
MQLKAFQKDFNSKYSRYIDWKIDELLPYCEDSTLKDIVHYMSTYQEWWKRTRPFLIHTIYNAFNWEWVDIDTIGISYELLHAIALVHDDIMDQWTMRHWKLAYHTFIEKLYEWNYHAWLSQWILVWDRFLSWSYENLYENCENKIAIKYFAKTIQELIMWQMLDTHLSKIAYTWEIKQIENKDRLKSWAYSFIRPMCIWWILAWCNEETLQAIENLGNKLWIIYQVRDDLLDITWTHGHENKTRFSDLSEWNQTLVLTNILNAVTPQEKELILSHRSKKISPEDIEILWKIIENSGALEATRLQVNTLLDESQTMLDALIDTTKKEYTALSEIIDYLRV